MYKIVIYENRRGDCDVADFILKLIILLHHFVKKTNKTPRAEIEKARRELNDYRQRRDVNENMG